MKKLALILSLLIPFCAFGDSYDTGPATAETDPVWAAASGSVVYAESDPLAVLATGARRMSGNLDMGANAVTNIDTLRANQIVVQGLYDPTADATLIVDVDLRRLTNIVNVAFSDGTVQTSAATPETDPVWAAASNTAVYLDAQYPNAVLATGTRAMSGNLDMGGNSITNVATNSLSFANGTRMGADNDNLLFGPTGSTMRVIAFQSAVDSEATTRGNADTTHTTDIADLDSRMDKAEGDLMLNFLNDNLRDAENNLPMPGSLMDTFVEGQPEMWVVDAALSSGYTFTPSYFESVAGVAGTDMSSVDYHYLLNDSNATSVVDGHHATTDGAIYELNTLANTDIHSVAGKIGAGLDCDRSERGNIRSAWNPQSAMRTTNFTISFWVKFDDGVPSAYPNTYFFGVWDSANNNIIYGDINESTGDLNFRFKNNGTWGTTMVASAMPDGETPWYHIVIQKNESLDTVYVWTNAHQVASTALSGTQSGFTSPGNLFFGTLNFKGSASDGDNQSSDTQWDDIRIEERLWTSAEIAAVYAAGVGTEDDNIGGVTGSNMTLVSTNFTYDISFGELHGWLLEQGTTASTNRVLEVSVDGRATWTEIPLTFQQVQILGETNVLSFGTTNPATSGTNLAFRVRGTNMVADSKVNAIIVGGN